MKKRKAQATILIIVAIVIVLAIGITAYIINENKKAESEAYFSGTEIQPTVSAIQSQTLDCAKEISTESLFVIGFQGGYHVKPDNNLLEIEESFIPLYYNQGTITMPSKRDIEENLASYVDKNIANCLNLISYETYDLKFQNPITKTIINKDEVTFVIKQPITVEKEGFKTDIGLDNEVIAITSELDAIIDLAYYLTNSHLEDPELYCITCLADSAEEDDLYVDISNLEENEMFISIYENHTSSETYSFEFVYKYTGDERTPTPVTSPPNPPTE